MKFTDTNITDLTGAKIPVENTATEKGYVTIDQITGGGGGVTDAHIGAISGEWAVFASINAVPYEGYIRFDASSGYNANQVAHLPPGANAFVVTADYLLPYAFLPMPVDSTLTTYIIQNNSFFAVYSSSIDALITTIDSLGAVNGIIDVSGLTIVRTSASDAAVTNLLGKGWEIYEQITPEMDGYYNIPNNGMDVVVSDPRVATDVYVTRVDGTNTPVPNGDYFYMNALAAYGIADGLYDATAIHLDMTILEASYSWPTALTEVTDSTNMLNPFSMTFFNGEAWIKPN